MTAAAVVFLLSLAAALTLATTIQTCYLESLRLRKRELDALRYFEEHMEDELAERDETGALAFSLWKHTLLVLMPVAIAALAANFWLAAVYSFAAMLTFAYLLPQFLYRRTGGEWMRPLAPLLRGMVQAARPLISLLRFMKTVSEFGDERAAPEEKADEAHALIDAGAEEGLIAEDEKNLLKTVIDFRDKVVREVMTPRPNIVAISEDKTLEELRQLVVSEQYSRIPVYRGTLDNMQGFVHVRDMFEIEQEKRVKRKVREIMRPLDAVPETKLVRDLLKEMQRDGKHLVVVVDEYGNTAGLVTMEDLVEEIVGEIRDEHEPASDYKEEAGGVYVFAGNYDLDHLRELVAFEPGESTEATTVGGLVTEWFGYVPSPGETLEREGIRIEVLAASDLRVEKVRLAKLPAGGGHA